MLSNAYSLAKFRFDTAENEPAKNFAKKFFKIANFAIFADFANPNPLTSLIISTALHTEIVDLVGRGGKIHLAVLQLIEKRELVIFSADFWTVGGCSSLVAGDHGTFCA